MPITRRWLLALAVTLVATLISIAYVDRPTAVFFAKTFDTTPFARVIRALFAPAIALPALALMAFAGTSLVTAARRKLLRPAGVMSSYACAILIGISAERILKSIWGRLPPREFILQHAYGFRWLHGNLATAFPSGTAIVAAAIAAVMWSTAPKARPLAVAFVLVPSTIVVVLSDHFVGDVVAGVFIGIFVGWATLQLIAHDAIPCTAESKHVGEHRREKPPTY